MEEAVTKRETTIKKMLSSKEEFTSNFKRTITPTKQRRREESYLEYGRRTSKSGKRQNPLR